jgi:nitroreductase
MEVLQTIHAVRAVRRFRPTPLSDDLLRRILDAGRRAGSSKNLQRWDFILVTDRPTLQRLASVGPWAGHLAGAAAAVALVTPDPRAEGAPLSVMFDLGRAAQNMVLAAWALGIGSVPATVYEQDRAREILGYPPDRHCEYLLSLGYPADPADLTRPPRTGGRRPLEEVLHRGRWGSRSTPR